MTALRRVALASLAAVSVLLPACRTASPAHGSDASAESAIRALDATFPRMVERREHRALVESYYSADAVLMPPNEPAIVGRAAIEVALATWPPVTNFVLNSDDVVVSGDLAYSRGTYSMTLTPPGAAPIHDTGKFLEILRRQSDGSWKVTRDIYNSDLPAAGE